MNLKIITDLALRQRELEVDVEELEELLKNKKALLQKLSENDLPEAMDEAGLMEFKLSDGRRVTVEESYHAKIPEKMRHVAYGWLREHGHDGVIKRVVSVGFGKGEDEEADHLLEILRERVADKEVKDKADIHHSTLKALVKEFKQEGIEFPEEAFGLYIRRYTKIG